MIADISLFGIFIDVRLVSALVAGLALVGLRRLLGAAGAYRLLWHPALADLALFVLLWAAVAWAFVALQGRLVPLLG